MGTHDAEIWPIPAEAELIFKTCWQLENWLRTVVYVELRANFVDWESPIRERVGGWPPSSQRNDKRLHHMSTSHQLSLSYLTFGQLWDIISSDQLWDIFSCYFPPKHNVETKIEEVKTIRNRIAHFRDPHEFDWQRLSLFMCDLKKGVDAFQSRYTDYKPCPGEKDDPVLKLLEDDWGRIGYPIELLALDSHWVYACGRYRDAPLMNARLDLLASTNCDRISGKGIIYVVTVKGGNNSFKRKSDTAKLFNGTMAVHSEIIHFRIRSFNDKVTITIPAVLGPIKVAEVAEKFLIAGVDQLTSSPSEAEFKASMWPEYVLGPESVLT